jgi:flagella basal body P-ring formation protein FlgA
MKFKIFVLLNVLYAFCLVASDAGTIMIKKGNVYVSSGSIFLGDVADLDSSALQDADKLKDVFIRKSALPGLRVSIEKGFIQAAVNKYYPGITVEGPAMAEVYTTKAMVERADIEKAAVDFLKSNVPWQAGTYDIKVRHARGGVSVPSGTISLRVKQDQGLSYKGSLDVAVDIYVENALYKTEHVSVTVKVEAPCAIAAVDLERQAAVYPQAVTMEARDITYMPDDVITDPETIYNRVAARAILKGAVLTADMFQSPPLFKRNSNVDVVVKINSVIVQSEGTALSDGRQGDTVTVRLKSGKSVTGSVDGSGKVIIEK